MTAAEAIAKINDTLSLAGDVTKRGDEFKAWLPTGTGDVGKAYLNAAECSALAEAFGVLAATLAKGVER